MPEDLPTPEKSIKQIENAEKKATEVIALFMGRHRADLFSSPPYLRVFFLT